MPGSQSQWAPDRLADIRHIVLELTVVPEKAQLRGTVTHHVTPIGEPLTRLPFNLEELTVDAVKVGGRETRFHHEGGTLEVFLSPALQPGREVPISITYHGSPRTGLNFTAHLSRVAPHRPEFHGPGQELPGATVHGLVPGPGPVLPLLVAKSRLPQPAVHHRDGGNRPGQVRGHLQRPLDLS